MTCTGCEGKVEADHRSGRIDLEYDLGAVTLADVEVKALGYPPDDGLLSKFKRGWIHYTEENERGNLYSRGGDCYSGAEHTVGRAARGRL